MLALFKLGPGAVFNDFYRNICYFKSIPHPRAVIGHESIHYACLYASLENTPITSLTISFVESHYPRELLVHLREIRNYKVEEKSPGIYTVIGDILPIQIIDSRQLSDEENLWLKGLNRHEAQEALRIAAKASSQRDGARIGAYLDVIIRANIDVLREAYKMSDVSYTGITGIPALDEFLEETGYIAQYEARREAKVEERKAIDIAKNLVSLGLPLETVVSATGLGIDKVEEMYNKQITINSEQ